MTIRYAKIINNNTKLCEVGLGSNIDFYKSLGMKELDVEQCWNGSWYLTGYCPAKPEETLQQRLLDLENKYNMPRVIREGILANPSMYSEFNVNKAKDLENIAEAIRKVNND